MMKKLLVLTLVLGLASAANAVLIDVDGQVGQALVNPDTAAVITLISEDTANFLGYVIVDAGGSGVLSGVEALAGAGNQSSAAAYDVEPEWGLGFELTVASTAVPTDVAIGPQFTLSYSYSGDLAPGTTISLYVDPEFEVAAAQTTIVPEPMTVLLLGLGGLFLRRRK
ncbi:MAG: PEP-CTERM sorting domain-containing protein [Planctomycetota bacterium]|jgi:hypothetical protein